MKKVIALTLAGVMFFTLPVLAAPSPSAAAIAASQPSAAVKEAAAANQMSVGEYTNNIIVNTPGMENVIPIGQGGHVIINGATSNQTFFLVKATKDEVNSALNEAALMGSKLLNVFGTRSVISKFQSAQVNFYAKGIKAGQNIIAKQLINGEWIPIQILEIREDHIVVELTAHGKIAFFLMQ